MDKLRAMATFVRIVDGGSLTAAADSLRTSLPSVVRSLAALEAALDVRLLNRTTRRIALTDEGREYYERSKRVLADVDDAETAMSARRKAPRGRLRVTAPVMFGRMHVAPLLTDFVLKYPALQIEVLLVDRVVDLVEEGIDVGVRIGHLPDSSLVALPVGQTRRLTCASPAYLRRVGIPRSLADVAAHRCVSSTGLAQGNGWTFSAHAKPIYVAVNNALISNQIDAALDACLRGVGLGQFLCYQVRAALAGGKLRRVLREHEPAPLPIHVIYPHTRLLSSNVRAFVDWTVPKLRAAKLGAS
jgi:DNA-binding transcriptional LysR family regulator